MSRSAYTAFGVAGLPEIVSGDDLVALIAGAVELADGDVLAVTSKIVSKAEGRWAPAGTDRDAAVVAETASVVARRGNTRIVRTRHGFVLAAAGTDTSNTAPGTVLLLPLDPDGSARRLREGLAAATGRNVAVVVTDTLGRAWRQGQVDLALGVAGLEPLLDLRGTTDASGNVLAVTEPAIADEVASAAELVKNKADGVPVAVLRGLADRVLPAGEHGPGAAAYVRSAGEDMFRLGVREAVWEAVAEPRRTTAATADLDASWPDLDAAVGTTGVAVERTAAGLEVTAPDPYQLGRAVERLLVLLHAEGIAVADVHVDDAVATLTFT